MDLDVLLHASSTAIRYTDVSLSALRDRGGLRLGSSGESGCV